MKTSILNRSLATIFFSAVLTIGAASVFAQNSSVTSNNQTAPALAYGTANVLKLAQANVGEETIVAYIEKTGQGYGSLNASEIIYLREQGVSDRVLTTMLAQEKQTRDATIAQQSATQQNTVAATQVVQSATPVVVAATPAQIYYAQPAVTYVQAAPAPLIVMRDSSPRLVDYGIYPRYSSYGCYPGYSYRSYNNCYPRVSFSVGFSGRHGGFGFSTGGFHGGYCR